MNQKFRNAYSVASDTLSLSVEVHHDTTRVVTDTYTDTDSQTDRQTDSHCKYCNPRCACISLRMRAEKLYTHKPTRS